MTGTSLQVVVTEEAEVGLLNPLRPLRDLGHFPSLPQRDRGTLAAVVRGLLTDKAQPKET